jgi:hypothetical protein
MATACSSRSDLLEPVCGQARLGMKLAVIGAASWN